MASISDTETSTQPRSARYHGVAIGLHWAIALAMIGLIFGGWFMTDLPDGHPLQYALYQFHKSVGITILTLTIARVAWRIMNPPPPLPSDMKALEKTASHAVHLGFYGLMIAMPLTGWLYVSTATQFDIPTVIYGLIPWPDLPFVGFLTNDSAHSAIEFVHSKLAWLTIGLVGLHVAGAVKHELSDEEGVLKRMIPGLFGKTSGPGAAARGAAISFGGAAMAFIAITGLPVLAQTISSGPSSAADAVTGANWQVEAETSSIAFAGVYNGSAYGGDFGDWSAEIAFFPDDLAASQVEVAVTAATIDTGSTGYNQSARGRDFFDVETHPTIAISVSDFSAGETTDYTATATIRVKESEITVPLDFDLEIDGDKAAMTASVELLRETLQLGMSDDPGFDWLDNEVAVDITVNATRISG